MKRLLALLSIALAGHVSPGCDPGSLSAPPSTGKETETEASGHLLLLAAASTTDAVTEAARRFERDTGVAVKVTAAASNALAAQILAGAPGHVFLSANPPWAEEIEKQGDALEARDLLSNRLVIVVPSGNPAGVRSPRDLLGDRVTHVALAGEKVPAGLYAEQALRHAEVYEALVSRGRVARGQDVRLTLGFVETGEAQAGVVYATDARASDDVDVVHTFDPRTHERIVYPLVLLEGARARPAARRLYDFLRGAEAMAVFETHGFSPAGSQPRATTD